MIRWRMTHLGGLRDKGLEGGGGATGSSSSEHLGDISTALGSCLCCRSLLTALCSGF